MIRKTIIALLLSSLAAFSAWQCGDQAKAVGETYASLSDTVEYVGINTCRECHSDIYETFIRTGMGKSFDVASREKSSAVFNNQKPVYDKNKDLYYLAFWQNDSLMILEYRLNGKDTVHQRIETISYIVGSGHHTNSHIINKGGYLHQAPLTFYTQKGIWDLPPGFENGNNTRFSRMIGLECMSCHNSYPEVVPGSENKYNFVDNGIGCERCHGPGEAHVAEKRSGKIVDITTRIDYSIVNPAKLPIDLQFDICQRCHVQGNAVLNDGMSFFDFRPGMPLSDVMNIFMPVFEGRENDHIMASHAERLKLSKCYTETVKRVGQSKVPELKPYKNALTCVTCHNPHVSVKESGSATFNAACGNCHGGNKGCTEKPQMLEKKNNDCVSCHMPPSGATDIPHVSVHDHYIRIPSPATADTGARVFKGIACINNPDAPAVARGRAFIAYFEKFNFGREVLDSARKYFSDKSPEDISRNFNELVNIAYLEQDYEKVIRYAQSAGGDARKGKASYDNKDAWTFYRIGESYENTGKANEASIWFGKAYELTPLYPEFANKYATALARAGQTEKALQVLKSADTEYPYHPAIASNLGYLTLAYSGDTTGVMSKYNRAIALDPDYPQALMNKAGLLMVTGKKAEAKKILEAILRKDPENKNAKDLVTLLMN